MSRYLKQEVIVPAGDGAGRLSALIWHPENPLQFLLLTQSSCLINHNYATTKLQN